MSERFSARDYRRPDDQTVWPLFWCQACEYGALAGDFTPASIAAFYDIPYYTHGDGSPVNGERTRSDRLLAHLAWRGDFGTDLNPNQIKLTKPRPTFCDIGCGSGEALRRFKSAGYDVVGFDPDAQARRAAETTCPIYDGTAEHVPAEIKSKRFDIVMMSHVLEHCIRPLDALRNAKELLAPGGSLIVEVPNNAALGFQIFGAAWPWTDLPRHLHYFTETSLRLAIKAIGLDVSDVTYGGYVRQFRRSWIDWQYRIWHAIHDEKSPDFHRAAWMLLFRTILGSASSKYDSIRMRTVRQSADEDLITSEAQHRNSQSH